MIFEGFFEYDYWGIKKRKGILKLAKPFPPCFILNSQVCPHYSIVLSPSSMPLLSYQIPPEMGWCWGCMQ